MSPHTASCLCGSVKLTMSEDPKAIVLCHCQNCKQSSGSAFFQLAVFPPNSETISSGADLIKTYEDSNTKSGQIMPRSFCTNCGSPVFGKKENITLIPVGIIDKAGSDPEMWKPKRDSFPESREDWLPSDICAAK